MQTYLVSNLLRTNVGRVGLIFGLLVINFLVQASDGSSSKEFERDSLYVQWIKSKSTLPTLIYQLNDFNDFTDRLEAEHMIYAYGVGGVIIPNGDQEEVKQWINDNQKRRVGRLLHIVEVNKIFELPFNDLPAFPQQISVECFPNNDLAFKLGQAHANQLRKMGIGLIQFSNFPDYYSKYELQKVYSYFKGLSAGKISFYLTDELPEGWLFDKEADFGLPVIDANKIIDNGLLGRKTLKNYRKEHREDQLIIDQSREIVEVTLTQIERGAGLIVIANEPKSQHLVNALLIKDVQNKGYFKRQVKDYFQLLNRIEKQIHSPVDVAFEWKNIKGDFSDLDITLVQDDNHIVPIRKLGNKKIFTISNNNGSFELLVDKYKHATHFPLSVLHSSLDSLQGIIPPGSIILVDLTSLETENDFHQARFVCDSLGGGRSVVAFHSENVNFLKSFSGRTALIWCPEYTKRTFGIMVEMAFGARPIHGILPGYLQKDGLRKGITRKAINRLSYLGDDELNVDNKILCRIDSLVGEAIKEKMIPGCQIMMIKDGKVVYDKNFGYLTYDSLRPVKWDHIYDVASVTKTVATVPAIMDRMEDGNIVLKNHLGDYLTAYHDADNANLTIENILTHQSGLKSYIPFWRHAKYISDSSAFVYKHKKWRRKYSYHSVSWNDSIQSWIAGSKYNSLANEDGTYRYLYSDLGFMIMKEVVEDNCSCPLDQSVNELIYQPIGMDYTAFNPLKRFQKEQIAPTEQDKRFRSALLQGEVHDKNAALLDGVSGHAGLFSNANDLAKYMQMMLQQGYYGGVQYFSDSIVQVFTSKKNPRDRRALGWDKPDRSVGNASRYASEASFGHSGFTGTLIWADPKYDLIYIFLSNRIYPDPQNYKLIESNTRTKIHDLMYESFLNSDKTVNSEI